MRCSMRLDRVSAWVDELERHGRLPDDAEGVFGRTVQAPAGAGCRVPTKRRLPRSRCHGGARRLAGRTARRQIGSRRSPKPSPAVPPLLAVSYAPDDGCFYRGEDPFNLFPQLTGLKALRVFFREPPVPLAETDPFHSALAFRALVGQPRAEVEHLFRYVIEQVAIVAVPPEALILPDGDAQTANQAIRISSRTPDDSWRRRDFAGLRNAVAGFSG